MLEVSEEQACVATASQTLSTNQDFIPESGMTDTLFVVGSRSELVPAATYLRAVLTGDQRYSARWSQHARRMHGSGPNVDAVSRVLVEHRWSNPADREPKHLRSMRDRVRRAFHAETFTPDTLHLFIDAFDMRSTDAEKLRRLLFDIQSTRSSELPEQTYRTLSLQELHVLGPDGLPAEHRTLHSIESLTDGLESYAYTFDSPDVIVRAESGASAGPIEPCPPHPGFWQVRFHFHEPMAAGEVKIFEYVTSFRYETPPPPEFRRGAGPTGLSSLSMRVRFHEARLPSSVTWSRWSSHRSDESPEGEAINLDGERSAHRFVSSLRDEVVGFTWKW